MCKRFTLNKIPFSIVEGKNCLDLGCGSGRYAKALIDFGAKTVIGIDWKKPKFKHKKFVFKKGNVLDIPFKSNNFDFVFCNGVLHYNRNWRKGIKEIYRVLKPNCWTWIYLMGDNNLWKITERVRKQMIKHKGIEKDIQKYLLANEWLPNKVFFLLDAFFPPERFFVSKKELLKTIKDSGFSNIKYLSKYLENVPPETHLRFLAKKPNYGVKGEKNV